MANDYQGEAKDFAMVVPVPTVLKKEQVKVANPNIMERLDAFSAPRLVNTLMQIPVNPLGSMNLLVYNALVQHQPRSHQIVPEKKLKA